MKTRTSTLLPYIIGAAALGVSALSAVAQDGPPPGPHHPPRPPLFQALDANHDGVLSADEIKNATAALLTLDKNKDGQLTDEEVRPPRPERGEGGGPDRHGPEGGPRGDEGRPGPREHADRRPGPEAEMADEGRPPRHEHRGGGGPRPLPPLVAALDANNDGVISADEIKNAAVALKALDKDGDGQISREEMRPAMPPPPPSPEE